jgi:RNA polymerase sigma-70 factor (ECF subfamily)
MTMTFKKSRASSQPLQPAESTPSGLAGSFDAIFLEHWPRVYALLVRLVGDGDEAEDLALDTFMRLYERKPADGHELNVGGWLHRVATNLGLNAIRGWKRRQGYELESGKNELFEARSAAPPELFADEEKRRSVRLILSQMELRQAQLLILRHSGHSYQEIAAALGVSVTSIGTLLNRAETEFEKRYRAAYPEGG